MVNDYNNFTDSSDLFSNLNEDSVSSSNSEDSLDFSSSDSTVISDSAGEDTTSKTMKDDVLSTSIFEDNSMKFDLPKNQSSVIKVIGVGGGGSNAVNHMINQGIKGVDFIICNTDAQALDESDVLTKIQLGASLTEGLGAGENPEIGEKSALESENEIQDILAKNAKMVFVTAGMGGGTGTGAAPIIARISKELDILTIGIVTVPFDFEGPKRRKQAQEGIEKMREYVDSLIVINNNKLLEVYGDLEVDAGFAKADEILMVAARSIAEVITQKCRINIDLNDAKTILKNSGTAIMGSGTASGEGRAQKVVENALDSPLLNDSNIKGASQILLLILSGKKGIKIHEIDEISNYLQVEAGSSANVILGLGKDFSLEEDISITMIATGVLGDDINPSTGMEERKVHILSSEKDNMHNEQVNPLNLQKNYNTDLNSDNDTADVLSDNDIADVLSDNDVKNTINFSQNPVLKSCKMESVDKKQEILSQDIVNENLSDISDNKLQQAADRKKRLQKFHNLNFNNQKVLENLESEPAYKRQGTELDHVEHSSSESVSRIVLDADSDDLEIKNNNNTFLHDNVD